ncbi:hypothetical protein ACFFOQ_12735 [Planobispora takensis]
MTDPLFGFSAIRVALLWASALAVLVCACSATGQRSAGTELIEADPRIFIHHSGNGNDAALIATVTYDHINRCLFLTEDDRGSPPAILPIWPEDTRPVVRDGKHGVQYGDDGEFIAGERIKVTGGFVDRRSPKLHSPDLENNCVRKGEETEVFVVSPLDSITRAS